MSITCHAEAWKQGPSFTYTEIPNPSPDTHGGKPGADLCISSATPATGRPQHKPGWGVKK